MENGKIVGSRSGLGYVLPVDRQCLVESNKPDWVQPVGNRHRSQEDALEARPADAVDGVNALIAEAYKEMDDARAALEADGPDAAMDELNAEIAGALGAPMTAEEIRELKAQFAVETGPLGQTIADDDRRELVEAIGKAFGNRVPKGEIDLVLDLWRQRYGEVEDPGEKLNFDAEPSPPASPMMIDGKFVKHLALGVGAEMPKGINVMFDTERESSPGYPFQG